MTDHRELPYTDQLLADGSVYRRYGDGRQEWRRRIPSGVEWRDDENRAGTDVPLGRKIIKRVFATGETLYARELGYGRTAWRLHPLDPSEPLYGAGVPLVITVNRSAFRGRVGAILAGIGAAALLGALVAPPYFLSPQEEEELRRAAVAGGSSGDGGEVWDSGWDDPTPAGAGDDDFG